MAMPDCHFCAVVAGFLLSNVVANEDLYSIAAAAALQQRNQLG